MNTLWTETAQKLYDVKLMRKHYEELESHYLNQLKELSDNKEIRTPEFEFKSIERPGSVDYKQIPELKNVDLNKYRKENIYSWVLKKVEKLPVAQEL